MGVYPNTHFRMAAIMSAATAAPSASTAEGAHVCSAACPLMHEVFPCVWVGSLLAARDRGGLELAGITAVVAAGAEPAFPGAFEYLAVELLDLPWADVLAPAAGVAAFIERALAGGGRVLVHCVYGQSRSAALAAAYGVLRRGLSSGAALAAVRAGRPCVSINAGFLHQLELLGAMVAAGGGGGACRAGAQYRLLAAAAARRARGALAAGFEAPNTTFVASDGSGAAAPVASDSGRTGSRQRPAAVLECGAALDAATAGGALNAAAAGGSPVSVHCGKCGVRLFTTSGAVRGSGAAGPCDAWPLHGLVPAAGGPGACASIFTGLPEWADVPAEGVAGADAGRLACRACGAKLGGWNWGGASCSCGVHVAPAVQVARSKVALRRLA